MCYNVAEDVSGWLFLAYNDDEKNYDFTSKCVPVVQQRVVYIYIIYIYI